MMTPRVDCCILHQIVPSPTCSHHSARSLTPCDEWRCGPTLKSASTAATGERAGAQRQITQFVIKSAAKGVHDELAPSSLVLLPFTMGLDPFEQIIMTTSTENAFRRRHGRGGAKRTMSSLYLLWTCRNATARGESKTVL